MSFYVGLDVGSVSVKLAAIAGPDEQRPFADLSARTKSFRLIPGELEQRAGRAAIISEYRRILGSPMESAWELLQEVYALLGESRIAGVRATGSGGRLIANALGLSFENEFKAIACAAVLFYPEVRTILEMGGESSKYLRLDCSPNSAGSDGDLPRHAGIADYATSGACAAGTGAFLDQQASRLQYRVEEIGAVVSGARCAASIAGRCSVFAKSDMIHAQQKGYATDEILRGLCKAVARNLKSSLVKGKQIVPPVAFIGGVAQNSGVVQALQETFRLAPGQLIVPELHSWLGALGSALLEEQESRKRSGKEFLGLPHHTEAAGRRSAPQPAYRPLSLENVLLLRKQESPCELSRTNGQRIPAYLGIDIGSVSTNLAVIDDAGQLLHEIYLYTVGRPIEVVHQGLQEIEQLLGAQIEIRGLGTTGSGRELIGELAGADTVNDEITAHKTGALYVHETLAAGHSAFGPVDTIFEIGGQDSKFISIERGVVVDFAMNEACAAGTGSFLEEQAERLGIRIKDEFARLALSSQAPERLGERCTVFMERDLTAALHRGAQVHDLAAGLAYSVALNYLNRVVRGRKIGEMIYFQGGTAYNDAVAAAFSLLLGKPIIVPPHNGVIGAIGVALIARERARATARPSAFRGYDLSRTRFQTREFICKACSNYCDMKEITIAGQKTYWGDKCSDKFRKRARTDQHPVIEDLVPFRERALLEGFGDAQGASPAALRRPAVGIPQAMYYFDRFPFWRRYLEELGFHVVVSRPTDHQIAARGVELSVAEPCFPVQIAHGHVAALLETGVDYVLVPNVLDLEACQGDPPEMKSKLCPWNQTLPHVLRAAPAFSGRAPAFLSPTVYFGLGRRYAKRQLADYFARFGIARKKSDVAVDAAYASQQAFAERLLEAGHTAWATLERTGEPAVLLVGRPYNLYDRTGNCDIPRKLRALYGVNVLPLDFLPLDAQPVSDFHSNMYWYSGRRILAAGLLARRHPNLHIVYLTNFKCGPDSFLKHFLREVSGAPFLVLQFDGHGNDAGYLTRCEAYLDSKGLLRCHSRSEAA